MQEEQEEAEKVDRGRIQSMLETMNITIMEVIMEQQEQPTRAAEAAVEAACTTVDMVMPDPEERAEPVLC